MTGVMLTAPTSGAGKTTVTLGILRALTRRGVALRPAKSGPDYIDPAFHAVAAGQPSINLDAWAMTPDRLKSLTDGDPFWVVEGAMGFFDGAGLQGRGSAADLARCLGLGYVLIVDCGRMAQSVRAIVRGVLAEADDLPCLGIILNRVGSPRHGDMLRHALSRLDAPVLGAIPRSVDMSLPERHLGLVQARETNGLDAFIDSVANVIEAHLDLTPFLKTPPKATAITPKITPPAQHIAVADDVAFAFAYPHMLDGWRAAGATVTAFSPLADEAVPDCDFVFLPGGYPELHAGRLATSTTFFKSLKSHAKSKPVYGECGGYMILGDGLVDADGNRHQMAGLLRLETSFAQRKLHLGYRNLTPLGPEFSKPLKAHEFHYASTLTAQGPALFHATDADGTALGDMGLRMGNVYGSFAHIIDGL